MTSRLTVTLTCSQCGKVESSPGRVVGWLEVRKHSLGDGPYIDPDLCSYVCVARWAAERAGLSLPDAPEPAPSPEPKRPWWRRAAR